MSYLAFFAGLALLIVGAELLVRGASRLARRLGMSSLVIGLTVVAFGTSSPELAVSVKAALAGQGAIAVGNVVGSNVFNVLFILGASALIAPLAVSQQLVRWDVPLMILCSVVALVFAWDGRFGRLEGAVLLAGLAAYVGLAVWLGRRAGAAERAAALGDGRASGWGSLADVSLVAVGLALLVVGSRWLVDAAAHIAGRLGVSELVIALTLVAVGTSLPEVVTSIVASLRGERDIAVGNVVGSNLFNLLGVLGASSLVSAAGVEVAPAALRFDLPIMVVVAVVCLPIVFTGAVISRTEGVLLVGSYVAYTLYLLWTATHPERLSQLSGAVFYFAVPLAGLGLSMAVVREIRRRRG